MQSQINSQLFLFIGSFVLKKILYLQKNKYSTANMDTMRMTDDGCIFSEEDYIFNIKWKVANLISQGLSENKILTWENNEKWHYYAKKITELMIKENINEKRI